ncbi:capsid protein [Sporosarcina sp. ANT_H38]|uniref:phage tail terminator protein n=1 Tax=Sporosarcina sp. ANT_H38 TaxID=2597358 RepID=UPI0011F3733B|nr:minor capsid protein [Sporosarcina sp. ANT_H38]KAA0941618.1 capsid protein [Sporosarcina sp. ANT_H38]
MDFTERLCDKINTSPKLPTPCKLGYLGVGESFVLYPLPGSRVTQEYMDGTTDQQLNYEISFKSKSHRSINDTLWAVQTELEKTKKIISGNGSFEFDELIITNKPFINQIDEQGWFVFLLNVQAKITVF